ncbi:MAG: hypothetical protein MHPSP_002936, partial [Paramarteilia canceri]
MVVGNSYNEISSYNYTDVELAWILVIRIIIGILTILTCCCGGCFCFFCCNFCCGCCCGQCGDPPIKLNDLFKGRSKTSSKNAKTYIDKGYEEMTKADTFLKMYNQHTLAKQHLEGANKKFETALKLLLDQNKLYNSPSHSIQLNENNELIASVERNIEENAQKIKSLNDNCANL